MSDRTHRPTSGTPTTVESPAPQPQQKVFRSLKPGEIGPARMNPVNEERAAASQQIQRTMKAWRAASGAAGQASVPKTTGSPLSGQIRSKMEPKLGANLGNVRIHTGGESADAAKGFGARAFTVGDDVHFNAGEFNPGTKDGDKLLAHELTHVVQGQRSGIQRKAEEKEGGGGGAEAKGAEGGGGGGGGAAAGGGGGEEAKVSEPHEPAEKEADEVADKVAAEEHGGGDEKKDKKKEKKKKEKEKNKKDAEKAKEGGAPEEKKEGEAADEEGEEGGEHKKGAEAKGDAKGGEDEKKGEEKPAPISAKLEGVGTKLFLAPSAGKKSEKALPPTVDQVFAMIKPDQHPKWPAFQERVQSFAPDVDAKGAWTKIIQGLVKGLPAAALGNIPNDPGAAPDVKAKAAQEIVNSKEAAAADYQDVAKNMFAGKFQMLTGKKGYGLWSGGDVTQQYAASKGYQTLETTAAGQCFNGLDLLSSPSAWNAVQPLWAALSSEYAKQCEGEIHGFMRWMGPTFKNYEQPIIKAKQAIPGSKVSVKFHAVVSKVKGDPKKITDLTEEGGPYDDEGSWQAAINKGKAKYGT